MKLMNKLITLQIKYVENQSSLIPDETREISCAGGVIERVGMLFMQGEIKKESGSFWHGYKVQYQCKIVEDINEDNQQA